MPFPKIFLYLFVLSLFSCVQPIENFVQKDATSYVTIEADISDDPELCKIRLTNSANRILSVLAQPITKAEVYVMDDKGVKTYFKEGAIGFQTARLLEVPLEVAGKSHPFVFFFQPSKTPVIATTKKKINKTAPIKRCTFLKILKTATCIFQS